MGVCRRALSRITFDGRTRNSSSPSGFPGCDAVHAGETGPAADGNGGSCPELRVLVALVHASSRRAIEGNRLGIRVLGKRAWHPGSLHHSAQNVKECSPCVVGTRTHTGTRTDRHSDGGLATILLATPCGEPCDGGVPAPILLATGALRHLAANLATEPCDEPLHLIQDPRRYRLV
jgi:hypothetical protein